METSNFKRILIAVDGSEHTLRIAEKGLVLARQLGAEAALVFVIDKGKAKGSVDANITPQEAEIVLKKEAVLAFDTIASSLGSGDFIKFMPTGFPKEEILKVAEAWDANLIVIGTKGKSGIVGSLMGSVAEYVLYHSKKAVMLVK
ncbi:MAG: universal stress protein [Bacteroidetes bacterium]|nr:universal stress protein [Bacteroidota bacterium]